MHQLCAPKTLISKGKFGVAWFRIPRNLPQPAAPHLLMAAWQRPSGHTFIWGTTTAVTKLAHIFRFPILSFSM